MTTSTLPPSQNDFCPLGRPFPASYEAVALRDPDLCLAEDPCSGDGVTTLWMVMPCSTTTTVAVADPPRLPVTGVEVGAAPFGLAVAALGVLILRACRRPA
jgi:hypothetical protein